MGEFKEINKKDVIIQNEISQTIDKYNKESISMSSQKCQIALIQSKVLTQA